ncbi:hypothetical protein HDU96_006423 [Phlyctochytrium bullatum]|nr:hypothetical protein HDU96_006423 [Phlyctochytrium bullatum]
MYASVIAISALVASVAATPNYYYGGAKPLPSTTSVAKVTATAVVPPAYVKPSSVPVVATTTPVSTPAKVPGYTKETLPTTTASPLKPASKTNIVYQSGAESLKASAFVAAAAGVAALFL